MAHMWPTHGPRPGASTSSFITLTIGLWPCVMYARPEMCVRHNNSEGTDRRIRGGPLGAGRHTLLGTNSSSITINPQIYKKTPYKPSDLTPVTRVLEAPFILVANPEWAQKNSIGSFGDIVEFARRNPEKLSYGSAGPGNISHLSFAAASNRARIKTTHVPYKSSSQAQLALISGELDAGFDTWTALPHIKAGKLEPLAVTSLKRMAQLPAVPTMQEAGIPDFHVTFWIGMFAPAGTPPQIVQRLAALSQAVAQDSKARESLSTQGEVVMLEPAGFSKRIEREVADWGAVIQRESITLD